MVEKGKLFVISAPSGTGKTTVIQRLKEEIPSLKVVVTFTTRKPRPGEKNGVDYYFVSEEEFKKMIKENKFIEWAVVYGNYYGTPKEQLMDELKKGNKILCCVDIQGGLSIKRIFPSSILIGILPPSVKEQEKRMRQRKGITEEEIKRRLEASKKERKILLQDYNFRVINKDIDTTVKKIKNIILKNDYTSHCKNKKY